MTNVLLASQPKPTAPLSKETRGQTKPTTPFSKETIGQPKPTAPFSKETIGQPKPTAPFFKGGGRAQRGGGFKASLSIFKSTLPPLVRRQKFECEPLLTYRLRKARLLRQFLSGNQARTAWLAKSNRKFVFCDPIKTNSKRNKLFQEISQQRRKLVQRGGGLKTNQTIVKSTLSLLILRRERTTKYLAKANKLHHQAQTP